MLSDPPITASLDSRLDDAYAQLEIDPNQVAEMPQISHVLRRCGSKERWLELLRGSSEGDARKICKLVQRHGEKMWALVPLEGWCVAAGITTKRMFALIAAEVFEQSKQEGLLVAASHHADVVEATVARAVGPRGTADARVLLQHSEFLPMSKNQVVFARGNVAINGKQENATVVLPPVEGVIRKLGDRFNTEILGMPEPEPLTEPQFELLGDSSEIED